LTSYTYDANGNVGTVTLASGAQRTFTYNTRNQVKSKSYSMANTPPVIYCYDGKVASGVACVSPSIAVPTRLGG
jgi:YD repeat-containing protein